MMTPLPWIFTIRIPSWSRSATVGSLMMMMIMMMIMVMMMTMMMESNGFPILNIHSKGILIDGTHTKDIQVVGSTMRESSLLGSPVGAHTKGIIIVAINYAGLLVLEIHSNGILDADGDRGDDYDWQPKDSILVCDNNEDAFTVYPHRTGSLIEAANNDHSLMMMVMVMTMMVDSQGSHILEIHNKGILIVGIHKRTSLLFGSNIKNPHCWDH